MGGWSGSRSCPDNTQHLRRVIAALGLALLATPAAAAEKVKMSIFQANLCCLPVYVAQHLKLFEKHGVEVELVYGTGIQVANSSSAARPTSARSRSSTGLRFEQGPDVKLLVVTLTLPPLA